MESATDGPANPSSRVAVWFVLLEKAVERQCVLHLGGSQFQLVETLAERCAEIILTEFNVPWVRLTLNKKGAVRGATDVGVIIERGERT